MIIHALAFLFLLVAALPAAAQCQLATVADWPVRNTGYQALLDGSINGNKVAVLVDTGAFKSLITRPAAKRFGLELEDLYGVRIVGVGGSSKAEYAKADVQIGDAARKGWPILVTGEHDLGNNIALILGDDFFEQVDVEFDLPHNRIRLFKPEGCGKAPLAYWAPKGASEVDLEPGRQIHFTVKLNDRYTLVMLDTGASRSGISARVAATLGRRPGEPGVEPAGCTYGIGQRVEQQWVAAFDTFVIGNETIRDPRMRILDLSGGRPAYWSGARQLTDMSFEMLLGFDFLKTHRVFVSRSQRKMYFTYEGGLVFPSVAGQACDGAVPQETADAKLARNEATIARDATDVQSLLARADAWRAKKDNNRALADYDAALKLEPRNAIALWQRGYLHQEMKNLDAAIADYDAAINAGARESRIYVARGNAWRAKGDKARALADYDQALALDPGDSYARTTRINYWLREGDEAKAAADMDEAFRRNPRGEGSIHFYRGLTFFGFGRWPTAQKDFGLAMQESPSHFHAIWLYLAQARGGDANALVNLEKVSPSLKGTDWPEPAVRYFAGKLPEGELFAAAMDPDAARRKSRECEATFYIAEKRLLGGDKDGAREFFKKAEADCPRNSIEYGTARADLARLK